MDESKPTAALGPSKPHPNGLSKPSINGRVVGAGGPRPRAPSRRTAPGLLARGFSTIARYVRRRLGPGCSLSVLAKANVSSSARLLTWYTIITVLFRCPATLDQCDDSSPRVCRP